MKHTDAPEQQRVSEAAQLLPCPFCGYTLSDYDAVAVVGIHDKCGSCILAGFKVVGWNGAERWNQRAIDASQPASAAPDETDSAPYWLCYAMADSGYIKKRDCERAGDTDCNQTSDCITEWCVVCAAKAWLTQQSQSALAASATDGVEQDSGREAEAESASPETLTPQGVASEESGDRLLNWIRDTKAKVWWNERIGMWVVQRYEQVVGNIAQNYSIRDAIEQAMFTQPVSSSSQRPTGSVFPPQGQDSTKERGV